MKDAAYIDLLAQAFEDLHGCKALHRASVPVTERFNGEVVWDGQIEVYELINHPEAKAGFAWAWEVNKDAVVTVLGIPPTGTPVKALQAWIASRQKS